MLSSNSFEGLVGKLYGMLASLVPLIIALTLVVFLWGIFQLVRSNSEDTRKDAIKVITFGVIALFVMVSVWGLVAILNNTFFGGGQLFIPQLR
jgi:ABC-type nickel/cobalt efflux system permease component RcnA